MGCNRQRPIDLSFANSEHLRAARGTNALSCRLAVLHGDAFGLATVVTLISIFPFDFSVIPNTTIVSSVNMGVYVILICISVGLGIGILVRSIKLIVNVVRGITSYQ